MNNNVKIQTLVGNRIDENIFTPYRRYTAGIVLQPLEVKDIWEHKVSIRGSYCYADVKGLAIHKMHVHTTRDRIRYLLLKRKEISAINAYVRSGYVCMPERIFSMNNLIKLDLVVYRSIERYRRKKDRVDLRNIREELQSCAAQHIDL